MALFSWHETVNILYLHLSRAASLSIKYCTDCLQCKYCRHQWEVAAEAWGSWHAGWLSWGLWAHGTDWSRGAVEPWSINKQSSELPPPRHTVLLCCSSPDNSSDFWPRLNQQNCWSFFPEILILSGKNNIDNWQYWRVGFIFIKLHYRLYWFIVTFLTEFYCKNIHCRTLFQFKMLMEDSFVHKKTDI